MVGMAWRRPVFFLGRVIRRLLPRTVNPLDGSWFAIVAFVLVTFVGGKFAEDATGPASPWPNLVRGFGVVIALAVALYLEWDAWAPHSPPSLTINPYFRAGGGDLTLQI